MGLNPATEILVLVPLTSCTSTCPSVMVARRVTTGGAEAKVAFPGVPESSSQSWIRSTRQVIGLVFSSRAWGALTLTVTRLRGGTTTGDVVYNRYSEFSNFHSESAVSSPTKSSGLGGGSAMISGAPISSASSGQSEGSAVSSPTVTA